jgi:dolichyl-phosphate beta-glucosyltransferase
MISAVIPVYNEADCVDTSVEAVSLVLRQLVGDDWEIVLVDDGGDDGTGELIEALATADPSHFVACHHKTNLGKGAAVRTGVMATRGDLVMFCDADQSTPAETLNEFVEAMKLGADVVVGNRKSPEADIERWQPAIRTWLGLGFTRLANAMTGLSINDYTCGFKLFRGNVAREVFAATTTRRWAFDVEVLARVVEGGHSIVEIPIRWKHVSDTRVRLTRDVVGSFVELIGIRRRLRAERSPKR